MVKALTLPTYRGTNSGIPPPVDTCQNFRGEIPGPTRTAATMGFMAGDAEQGIPRFRRVASASPRSEARDALIVKWRAMGYSYRQIGAAVGMTGQGVAAALQRIGDGRPGRA